MYCTDFVCTYKQHEDKDQDDVYRSQFIQAFSLNEWNDTEINKETEIIFNRMRTNKEIQDLLESVRKTPEFQNIFAFVSDDELTRFKILFIFSLFDKTHKLICHFINTGEVSKDIVASITAELN